ncbi:oligosaccharide flippase family protein [Rhodohalobacter sp. 8-1]|uniref:oligosaccharide flippase family protein n=1 Tax=Rhodohalobacter sp. 8-1 TaxID=3131972 RepID=UPI0030EC719E
MRNLTAKAFWILFSDGGAKLFGFFTTIYLARTFGADSYGLIVLSLSVMGICIWFSDLGIQTLATRAMAASDPGKRTPARYFWLKVSLSVVVILVSAAIVWVVLAHNPALRTLVLLFLLSLLPQSLQIQWYYHGIQDFKWITAANWIQGALYLGCLVFIVSSDDLFLVPLVYSLSILAGALTLLISYRGKQSLFSTPDFSKWPSDLKKSFYLGAGHFMAQSIILLPPILIGFFFSEYDVGYYSVAFKLVLVVMLADKMINVLLLANLSKLWVERPEDVPGQLSIVARWMIVFGSLGSIILFFISSSIIPFLFGSEYGDSIIMLKYLCFILPVTFLNSVYSYGLISFGQDERFLKSTLMGGTGAMLLMLAGGASSLMSVMLASIVAAEILITVSMYYQFKQTVRLDVTRFVFFGTPLLAISVLSGLFLPVHSLLMMMMSLTAFCLLIYGTGLIPTEDIHWLRRRITQ